LIVEFEEEEFRIDTMLGIELWSSDCQALAHVSRLFTAQLHELSKLIFWPCSEMIMLYCFPNWIYIHTGDGIYIDMRNYYINIIILLAVITKKTQIFFSTWLPIAMAVLIPISSLIYSSSLLTTRVYLIIRYSIG